MADLGTLRPGAVNNTSLPTSGASLIAAQGASTALSDSNDTTFDEQQTNSSGDYQSGRELGNTPGDFGTMATLSAQFRSGWVATPSNSTMATLIRIVGSDGTTILAAADAGGTFQQIEAAHTTTLHTSSVVGFGYVDTSADKTAWDAALVQIQVTRNRNKGGDGTYYRVAEAYITGTYNAGASTVPGTFTADAHIKKTTAGTFSADAYVKATVSDSYTADAYISVTTESNFTADAYVSLTTADSFTADSHITATIADNFSADAYVQTTTTDTFTADAHVFAVVGGTFTADSYITGNAPEAPVWVSPADTASVNATPVLVFTIPNGPAGNYHFNMEIDTADTFDTGNLRSLRSHVDQTGWEYDTTGAGGWAAVPLAGVASTYAGNDARYTVQTPLATGLWYRRVRVGL